MTNQPEIVAVARRNASYSRRYSLYMLMSLAVLPLSPILALLLSCIGVLDSKTFRIPEWGVVVLTMSVTFSFVNVTKVPESDHLTYLYFLSLARDASFVQFMQEMDIEPLYSVATWVASKILSGNDQLFIFSHSFLFYAISLGAVVAIAKAVGLRNNRILGALFIVGFFPPLFSLSAHLNRQVLASGLLLWAFYYELQPSRKKWIFVTLAILFHSSSAFFIPFFLLSIKRISVSIQVTSAILVAWLVILGVAPIGRLLFSSELPVLSKLGRRMVQYEYHALEPLGTPQMIYLSVVLCLAIFAIIKQDKIDIFRSTDKGLRKSYFALIGLCLFVGYASLSVATAELSVRFFFYIYFLITMPIVVLLSNRVFGRVASVAAIVFCPILFFGALFFDTNPWHYERWTLWISFPALAITQ